MAQGKVTDYFSAKKRSSAQPSKRRKVEINLSEPQLEIANVNEHRNILDAFENGNDQVVENKQEQVFSPLQTRAGRKSKCVTDATPKSVSRPRKNKIETKQRLIDDLVSIKGKDVSANLQIVDSVTSSWDDHDGTSTPKKETEKSEILPKSRKRTREANIVLENKPINDVTPEKRKSEKDQSKTETKAKKKLQLKNAHKDEENSHLQVGGQKVPKQIPDLSENSNIIEPSPKMSANVKAALKKCKAMKDKSEAKTIPKITPDEVKAKLAKTGKLDDLKAQLAKIKETSRKVKEKKSDIKKESPALKKFDKLDIEVPSEAKSTTPAYERFHHLATPSAPTLSLPYKYKLLAEQFRGMDTVVSMLHNRNENCTYSKLKAAVQELTKRNFEQKHVGQIKTVYPTAYELRQEKGLSNIQGFKDPKYQLTVTANLNDAEEPAASKRRQTNFKASDLLSRRNKFHNGLVHIVKQHHKEFLSKLKKPLTIPDDKITRWHPKFPLDEIPDVETSSLPQPPDVKLLQSAKDVLEKTRGKVMPQVQAALECVAKDAEANSPATTSQSTSTTTTTPTTTAAAPKGFQSLLERIRAKEAAKETEAMTRNPKEEKRIVMMKRLPNIMRIVRSQFVTEKKPALPLDMVIQKVLDSYRSCIAPGDIEPHLDLCRELLPEWISMVQIKKGKYLKIDKNLDLQALTDKVENISKSSKKGS